MVPVVLIRQAVLTHAEITIFDADEVPGFTGAADRFVNVALNRRQMRCLAADQEQPEAGRL